MATTLLAATACSSDKQEHEGAGHLDLAALKVNSALEQQMTELYQQAISSKQTKIVVYGANQANFAPVNAAFSKRFPGITATGEFMMGGNLESRLSIEKSTDKHIADVLENPAFTQVGHGYYEPFVPPTATDLPKSDVGPGNQLAAPAASLIAFEYDTARVSGADAPTSWTELTASRWNGQLVATDASVPGPSADALIKLQQAGVVDHAWLSGLKANKLQIKAGLNLAGEALVRGEYSVLLGAPYQTYLQEKSKGAPVSFVFPSDGAVISPDYYGLLAGAPHPLAARLFIDWLYTAEGQQAFAAAGVYPLMPNQPTAAGMPARNELKVLPTPDPARMSELYKKWGPMAMAMFGGDGVMTMN